MMQLMWNENEAQLSSHSWQQRLGTVIAATGICYLLLSALQVRTSHMPGSPEQAELQVWLPEAAKVRQETSSPSLKNAATASSRKEQHEPDTVQQQRISPLAQPYTDKHQPEASQQKITDDLPSVQQQPFSETDIYAAPRSKLLNPDSLRLAVRDARTDIQKMAQASGHSLQTPPLSDSERTQQQLQQATLPACTGQDALKFAPAKAAGISFTGLAALPFVTKAALSGKCRVN